MILRFFVVVGFLISIIAAGGSFSIYKSYQSEREQRLDTESKLMQSQDVVTSLKSDVEQQKSRIADLEGQVAALKQMERELKALQAGKDTEIKNLQGEIQAKADTIQNMQSQIEEYKKKERIPPPRIVAPGQTTTESTASSTETTSVDSSATTTAAAGATPSETVAPFKESLKVVPAEVPASEDSRILTVNRKFNFIVVNLGLRDGLRMGDKVQVVQGDAQKALAQIEKIYDKFSAATLLNEDKGNPVHEGDTVRKA